MDLYFSYLFIHEIDKLLVMCGIPLNNDIGVSILECSCYNDMVLTNIIGKHNPSKVSTHHHPNGSTLDQIDYITSRIMLYRASIVLELETSTHQI